MTTAPDRRRSQTETFSEFACDFRLSDAPESIRRHARLLIMDLIGCAIGALETPEATRALKAYEALDPSEGAAALWGTGRTATPQSAALFNGIIAHTLEFDDFLGIDHTGAVVLPALFAAADYLGDWNEGRILEAMILGYEIGRRMLDAAGGYSIHNRTGWHSTGTLGGFAAAAAVSKYLSLSPSQMTSALGLAGSVAGGTWAFNADGSMSKRLHPGVAAQHGLTAAFLAREGFTGPREILEAEWGGYFSLFAANHDCKLATLFTDLGNDLRLGGAGIKPYACCRGCHSAIDAIFAIKKRRAISADDMARVVVTCSPSQHRQLGNGAPANMAEAQLSIPFAIATAIRFDDAGLSRFSEKAVRNAETLRICRQVDVSPSEDWPVGKEPEVEVTYADGRKAREQVQFAKGDPRNPLSTELVVAKFRELTSQKLTVRQQEGWIAFGLSKISSKDLAAMSSHLHHHLAGE